MVTSKMKFVLLKDDAAESIDTSHMLGCIDIDTETLINKIVDCTHANEILQLIKKRLMFNAHEAEDSNVRRNNERDLKYFLNQIKELD